MKLSQITTYLTSMKHDALRSLFVGLGWDHAQPQQISTPTGLLALLPIAQKRGYLVLRAEVEQMPDKAARTRIEQAIYTQCPNKVLIFDCGDQRIW